MKLLSKQSLFCILLAVFAIQARQPRSDCINLCYSRSAGKGDCDICYYQCFNTAQAFFTSCRYQNQETNQIIDLNQQQCSSICYPEQQLQSFDQNGEKLYIADKANSQHDISNKQLQKQLQKEERDLDLIIFIMAGGCGLFTMLTIMMIIKCFEQKDQQKQKNKTSSYTIDDQKDMPDIHVDSSSSYYPSKEDVNQKINL